MVPIDLTGAGFAVVPTSTGSVVRTGAIDAVLTAEGLTGENSIVASLTGGGLAGIASGSVRRGGSGFVTGAFGIDAIVLRASGCGIEGSRAGGLTGNGSNPGAGKHLIAVAERFGSVCGTVVGPVPAGASFAIAGIRGVSMSGSANAAWSACVIGIIAGWRGSTGSANA